MSKKEKKKKDVVAGTSSQNENENELEELKAQNEEYLAGWKRALADYTNLQGDLMEQRAEMRLNIKEEFVTSLLPVLDNFDQAVRFKPAECAKDVENWLQGVLHVKTQFEQVLDGLGAVPFGQAGEIFDPALHTAISTQEDADKKDQEVLEVQVRGWKLGEKVVRPANVIINNLAS
jgi:molecular chaperone GrpE